MFPKADPNYRKKIFGKNEPFLIFVLWKIYGQGHISLFWIVILGTIIWRGTKRSRLLEGHRKEYIFQMGNL